MTYTVTTGLLWFALAFVVGGVVGYALGRVTHRTAPESRRADREAELTDELARERQHVAELERAAAERDALRAELEVLHRGGAIVRVTPEQVTAAPPPPDVGGAAEVLGRPVAADDLTIVVGLEPHVAMLCHWIGIHSWWDLATTPVDQLRTMLADAGSRFADVDPTTWPEQARLLAEGRWAEFAELAAALRATGSDLPSPHAETPTPPS